jgi:hypothetical protein
MPGRPAVPAAGLAGSEASLVGANALAQLASVGGLERSCEDR